MIASHSNIKIFLCWACSMTFKSIGGLRIHTGKVHNAVMSDCLCSVCSLRYTSEAALLRHSLEAHYEHIFHEQMSRGQVTVKKTKLCKFCPFKAEVVKDLHRHIFSIHCQVKLFQCLDCKINFGAYFNAKGHAQNIHKIKRNTFIFGCSVCLQKHIGPLKEFYIHVMSKHIDIAFPDATLQEQVRKMFYQSRSNTFMDQNHALRLQISSILLPQVELDLDDFDQNLSSPTSTTTHNCFNCQKIFPKLCDLDLHKLFCYDINNVVNEV